MGLRLTDTSSKATWIKEAMESHEGPLLGYVSRMTGDVERARDIVQDCFLKLWQQDMVSMNGCLTPWLYRVCRNRAFDVMRKERRMTTPGTPEILETSEFKVNTSDAVGPDQAGNAEISQMMDGLPDRQQEILRLKFQGGLSYRQIAEVMEITVSNVGFLLHTALKTIRERMMPTDETNSTSPSVG